MGFLVQSLILCYSMEEGAVLSTDSYSYIGSAQSFINGNGILHHPLHHIKKPINLSYAPGLSVCYALLNKIGIEWQWIPVIANIIFWFSTHLLFFLFILRLTQNIPIALSTTFLLSTNWSLIRTFSLALSEPLFICFYTMLLYSLYNYLIFNGNRNVKLFIIAIISLICLYSRYSSIPLIFIPLCILLIISFRKRKYDSFFKELFTIISVIIGFSLWILRNIMASNLENFLGIGGTNRVGEQILLLDSILLRLYQVVRLFVPGGYQYQIKNIICNTPIGTIVLIMIFIGLLLLLLLVIKNKLFKKEKIWFLLMLVFTFLCYLFILSILNSFSYFPGWVEYRHVTPILIMIIISICITFEILGIKKSRFISIVLSFSILSFGINFVNHSIVYNQLWIRSASFENMIPKVNRHKMRNKLIISNTGLPMVAYTNKYEILTYQQYKQQKFNYVDRDKVFIFWKESAGMGTKVHNENNQEIMKQILNNNIRSIVEKFEDVIIIKSNYQSRASI